MGKLLATIAKHLPLDCCMHFDVVVGVHLVCPVGVVNVFPILQLVNTFLKYFL